MNSEIASDQRQFETVVKMLSEAHATSVVGDKLPLYNTWAENYEKDLVVLDYRAPSHVADIISSHFTGDREAAVVLDVACGTGLVAKTMKQIGFKHFVGIDGSQCMLEVAEKKGLYEELKLCVLLKEPIPVQKGSFDVVVMCGALVVDHVGVSVVRELADVCKPGGLVCMTCRHGQDNMEYKASLERELKQMAEEGLWSCVVVREEEKWSKLVTGAGDSYRPGSAYLYKKL
ncbi:methyltransferase-like protein 27 [Halichoeres trimaculatus]|uniref:methyltransferase-like protein 27 n=1 Tax=Halichoeres trimaculatus TaxID=147232 RepID=UPI003D9F513F